MIFGLAVTLNEVSRLILVIGAIMAVIGAIVVFRKWTSGEQHVERYVTAWAGGILMLLLIEAVIKAMFS